MSRDEANRIARAAERVRRRSRGSLKLLLPTAVALGAGGAVAIGQIPDSGGTITACYYTLPMSQGGDYQYGTLRIIDPSKAGSGVDPTEYSCQPNEQTITWNQQGPTGPQGQTGTPGQQGQQGTPAQIVGETNFAIDSGPMYEVDMKLDGVPGDVTRKGFEGDVVVSSFGLGASGALSGNTKVTLQSFDIQKKGQDPATYTLEHDFFTGQKIDKGEVILYSKKGGKLGEVGVYDLKDMTVMNYQTSGNGGQSRESISFSYGEVKTSLGSGPDKLNTGWSTSKSIGGFDLTGQQAQ